MTPRHIQVILKFLVDPKFEYKLWKICFVLDMTIIVFPSADAASRLGTEGADKRCYCA